MASNDAGSSRHDDHRKSHAGGYELPTAVPLTPEDEVELASRIQRSDGAIEQLLDTLVPRITASLRQADCHPGMPEAIEPAVREGLEAALEEQCRDEGSGKHLVESAVIQVRDAVARRIGDTGSTDGGPPVDKDGWASERLTPSILGGCLRGVCLDGVWTELRDRQAALRRFVEANFHLVEAIARGFLGRGFDREDLLQEGAQALRKAARKYIPSDGRPFESYARTAIRNHLTDLVRTARGGSAHIARQVARFKGERRRLTQALGRVPSDAEVFTALGWGRTKRLNVERALTAGRPYSLDLYEEETGELPRDPLAADPEAEAEHREDLTRLHAALERLDEVERQALQLRLIGLPQTEAAARLNLSLHRVRTLEAEAMKKLRALFCAEPSTPPQIASPSKRPANAKRSKRS